MAAVSQKTVDSDEAGMRLDRWFKSHFPGLGFGALQKLLRTGQVRIDGKRAKASQMLEAGQAVRIPPMEDRPAPVRTRTPPPKAGDTVEYPAPNGSMIKVTIVTAEPGGR